MTTICNSCGGCPFRPLAEGEYRQKKTADFSQTVARIKNASPVFDAPVFIGDGTRRRADMAFSYAKKQLKFGFNEEQSHNIVDVEKCPLLTPGLNAILPELRCFLAEFCQIALTIKNKRKFENAYVRNGSVQLLQAENGIDILLNLSINPGLEHRLAAADFVNSMADIVRLSWRVGGNVSETIVEKMPPELYIAGYAVEVPQGVFLQASKAAETAMVAKVMEYMGNTTGKIADLFCGLGTFTYPLAQNRANEIIAADSSADSLQGLQKALNRNQIHNVSVINRNLFKYPFDAAELKGIKALVIDPPRAGAHEQCREIAALSANSRPEKIIYVSCNPKTFVYDAELLSASGYILERIVMADQFVYSKHQELIALFTTNPEAK